MAKETISQTEGLCKEVANCIRNAYDRGYKQGVNDVEKEAQKKEYWEQGYQEGLEDAWQCAKKIAFKETEGGIPLAELKEMFGKDSCLLTEVLQNYSVIEVIDRIKEYEEKQKADSEIKVGDEVYIIMENYPSVVTCVFSESGLDNPKAVHITGSGKYAVTPCNQLHKTGRHFDEIAKVLEQLKGESRK